MVRIGGIAVAQHIPEHSGIALAGMLGAFQNERGCAFAKVQAFTVTVKRAARLVGIYHQTRKARMRHEAQGICTAAQHALALACGDEIHCQPNGVRAGCAGIGNGQARAVGLHVHLQCKIGAEVIVTVGPLRTRACSRC